MPLLRIAGLLLCVAGVTCAAHGQQRPPRTLTTTTDKKLGFTIKAPKFLERVPVKDHDLQTVCTFKGSYELDGPRSTKLKRTLTLQIVQIDTQSAPTTGRFGAEPEPTPDSLSDARNAALNSGRSLEAYLENRGLNDDRTTLEPAPDLLSRKMESRWDLPFQAYRSTVNGRSEPWLVAFVTEDDTEIYGVVAYGAVEENLDAIQRAARSLERKTFDMSYLRPTTDPYEDSDLPDIERRRVVRANLIEGWSAHDTDNFILVTNVKKTILVNRMLTDLEIMRAAYIERFPPADPAALEVVSTVRVCDGYDDYLKYAGSHMRGTGGYWAFLDEELVLFNPERRVPKALRWLGEVDPVAVLYHEAMHQYLFYSNGRIPPASWFNEGYGEVFGGAKVNRTAKEIREIDRNDFRIGMVRAAKKQKKWPDLDAMLQMDQRTFYAPRTAMQNYAFGWAFCYFLELEGRKPPDRGNAAWAAIPRTYLDNLRAASEECAKRGAGNRTGAEFDQWMYSQVDRIQRQAYETTFANVDLTELEAAWIDAMKRW